MKVVLRVYQNPNEAQRAWKLAVADLRSTPGVNYLISNTDRVTEVTDTRTYYVSESVHASRFYGINVDSIIYSRGTVSGSWVRLQQSLAPKLPPTDSALRTVVLSLVIGLALGLLL